MTRRVLTIDHRRDMHSDRNFKHEAKLGKIELNKITFTFGLFSVNSNVDRSTSHMSTVGRNASESIDVTLIRPFPEAVFAASSQWDSVGVDQ